ncbi:hypothetical protein JCM8097_000952 [Rhodosporidiobolus ruineniae]
MDHSHEPLHPSAARSSKPRRSPPLAYLIGGSLVLLAVLRLTVSSQPVFTLSYGSAMDTAGPSTVTYTRGVIPAGTRPRTLRIGSFNVRRDYETAHPYLAPFALPAMGLSDALRSSEAKRWGERSWADRRERYVDMVLWGEVDVIGFQEALENQIQDLHKLLGEDEWGYVGVGRDDGKKAGESVPIFYQRDRLTLLDSAHFWLSPTPSVPGSKGWDAGLTRMVTFTWFADRHSAPSSPSSHSAKGGEKDAADFVVINTHWDDRGLQARAKSAKLILKLVEEHVLGPARAAQGGREPLVVLMGDLNSVAEEEGYQVLTGGRYPAEGKKGEGKKGEEDEERRAFRDARHEVATRRTGLAGPGAMSGRFGPLNTYTGFTPSDLAKVIDFIMPFSSAAFLPSSPSSSSSSSSFSARGQTKWKVAKYGVVPNFFEDIAGARPQPGRRGADDWSGEDAMLVSDHRLVVVGMEEVVVREER